MLARLHRLSSDFDRPGSQIHLKIAGDEHDGFGGRLVVALHNPQTRQQFARAERFGKVIVGAMIERGDFIRVAVPDREDEDGYFAPFAQPLEDDHAVHVGKHLVKKNDVGLAADGFGQSLFPGGGFHYFVAVALQAAPQQPADLHFVVHDQDDGVDGRGDPVRGRWQGGFGRGLIAHVRI